MQGRRQRQISGLIVLAAVVGFARDGAGQAADAQVQARLVAARAAAKAHAEDLRRGLHEALKAGGPKGAVGACTSVAPEVDGRITEQSGFEIGRTALKLRNPENAPDSWEKTVLEGFQSKIAAGADAKALEAYDVQPTREGQKLFRYMRPIMMSESCLSCHGPNVSQEIKALVARTYSDDKAIGFNIGELRGAFSLVQVVE